jgi:hypothetical protein
MKKERRVAGTPEPAHVQALDGTLKSVNRIKLINTLNRINFRGGDITLNFRHPTEDARLTFSAKPQACLDETLECRWIDQAGPAMDLGSYEFENFFLSDGLRKIIVEADLLDQDAEGIRFALPDVSHDVSARRAERHRCRGVNARVALGTGAISGQLVSFSALSFSVRLPSRDDSFPLPAPGDQADVFLSRDGHAIFAGVCEVVRRTIKRRGLHIAFRPLSSTAPKHKPKRHRSVRPHISPLPNIVISHPFTGKRVNLKARDISAAGFSVEEYANRAVLLAGMIIPEVQIEFLNGFAINCKAQVVYSDAKDDGSVKSGLAIVDMDVIDHTRLSSFLHQVAYKISYACTTETDLDELWEFFFDSGFIYPEKYAFIKNRKEHFKKLYRNLYGSNPHIARHVIYRDRGLIFGHVSMFRYYQRTWLLHHHAAISSSKHKAGLVVMEHIMQYINEFHRVFPELMQYICCYYQPENRFANRVFGAAARTIDDRRKCSLDAFAYFHLQASASPDALPEGWVLEKLQEGDLRRLQRRYAEHSGGLMLESLDLVERPLNHEKRMSGEYRRLGFTRERRLYSLKKGGILHAVMAVNVSDVGLNMSDLTNCVQAFVIEPGQLPAEALLQALAVLARHYEHSPVPALIYPKEYADTRSIPYSKTYMMTVLDLDHVGAGLAFVDDLKAPSRKSRS